MSQSRGKNTYIFFKHATLFPFYYFGVHFILLIVIKSNNDRSVGNMDAMQ